MSENKEYIINETGSHYDCSCGSTFKKGGLNSHNKTKKHMSFIRTKNAEKEDVDIIDKILKKYGFNDWSYSITSQNDPSVFYNLSKKEITITQKYIDTKTKKDLKTDLKTLKNKIDVFYDTYNIFQSLHDITPPK